MFGRRKQASMRIDTLLGRTANLNGDLDFSGGLHLDGRVNGNVRSTAEPLAVQHTRAKEPARGRRAATPRRIPWRGWLDILLRTYAGIGNHRLDELAAAVAFFELLAIFPALTALVSIYGVFASSSEIHRDLGLLAQVVPASTLELIGAQIDRIGGAGGGRLTMTFLLLRCCAGRCSFSP